MLITSRNKDFFLIFNINQALSINRKSSDRMARAFDRSRASRAVALDRSKGFDTVWHHGLLHKLKSYGISGRMFGLITSLLSIRQLPLVLDGTTSLQEHPINARVRQSSIYRPTLFLLWWWRSWWCYLLCCYLSWR